MPVYTAQAGHFLKKLVHRDGLFFAEVLSLR